MPPADVAIDATLVRALLREQHPDLADLPLVEAGGGWDNTLFRLGDSLLTRLPRREVASGLIAHEQRWVAHLAPRLPLAVPVPVRHGVPGCGYPWSWTITPWLPGRSAVHSPPLDAELAAEQLAAFVSAFHQAASPDAPGNPYRGVRLAERSELVLQRLDTLRRHVDAPRLRRIWEEAIATPGWSGPRLWIHGDLHPSNILVHDGRLSAVIDFGDLTSGDPATDLSVAWMLFSPPARLRFRHSVVTNGRPVDDDTWMRARGWAVTLALAYLAHSRDAADMGTIGRATLDAVLAGT